MLNNLNNFFQRLNIWTKVTIIGDIYYICTRNMQPEKCSSWLDVKGMQQPVMKLSQYSKCPIITNWTRNIRD